MVQALAFAELLAGGILFLSGWKGYSPGQVVRGEAGAPVPLGGKGAAPASSPSAAPLAGPGSSTAIVPHSGGKFELKRKDQGRDVQLEPGALVGAPGPFRVLSVLSDLTGFGPDYPIIEVVEGAFKGDKFYYGHTDALLHPGPKVYAGSTPVARTSTTGHNAPPGWLEFGFAPSGVPGPFGQKVPF